jgi:Sel1 repeat
MDRIARELFQIVAGSRKLQCRVHCWCKRRIPKFFTGMHKTLVVVTSALCIACSQNTFAGQVEAARLPTQQGDGRAASARIELGLMYLYGSGVERNHVRALMWFILAAEGQASPSKYYDLIAARMTPLQIKRAQALADICRDSNYTEC